MLDGGVLVVEALDSGNFGGSIVVVLQWFAICFHMTISLSLVLSEGLKCLLAALPVPSQYT